MRPKLLKSFLLVTIFWFIATTLYWSFSDPKVNLDALRSLQSLVPFLSLDPPEKATILGSLYVQFKVLTYWTAPLMLGCFVSFSFGYGLVWVRARREAAERVGRAKGTGSFRGLTLTLGVLPLPPTYPCDDVELGEDPDGLLKKATLAQKKLLEQIFGTLSAHPNAYPGPGNSGTALSVAMAVALKALEQHRNHPGLAACVAAAHELGKIGAYKKSASGEWTLANNEDREAAKVLSTLTAWWDLPPDDRMAVALAVKFKSDPKNLPEIEGNQHLFRLAQDLLYSAKDAATVVVEEEKQKPLEKHELPDVVFGAFKKALPLMAFQNKGLPKGVRAVAWKRGQRVYMLEIALRESVTKLMPQDVVDALQPTGKAKQRVQPFTAELLKALEANKWLVTEIEGKKLPPAEALWTIQAGKLEFRGVIVIEVPDEYLPSLPPQDSMYEVAVTGVLFTHALREERVPGLDKASKSALSSVLDMA